MNANTAKLVAFAFGFAAAQACAAGHENPSALTTIDVRANAALVVECRNEKLPDRAAVGAVLDSNNAGAINAGREFIMHYAHRECLRGAGGVAFVRDAATSVPSLAMAAIL